MYSLYFITLQRSGTRTVTKPLRSIPPEHRGTFHTQFWLTAIYIYVCVCVIYELDTFVVVYCSCTVCLKTFPWWVFDLCFPISSKTGSLAVPTLTSTMTQPLTSDNRNPPKIEKSNITKLVVNYLRSYLFENFYKSTNLWSLLNRRLARCRCSSIQDAPLQRSRRRLARQRHPQQLLRRRLGAVAPRHRALAVDGTGCAVRYPQLQHLQDRVQGGWIDLDRGSIMKNPCFECEIWCYQLISIINRELKMLLFMSFSKLSGAC